MTSSDLVLGHFAHKVTSILTTTALALGLTFGLAGTSLAADAADDDITVSGSIVPTITLTLPQTTIDYGELTPNNTGSPATGVTGVYDGTTGSTYTYNGGNSVSVRSNAAWSGQVEATLTAPSLLVSDLSLVDGTSRAFGSSLAFGNSLTGVSTYDHDYAIRVDWADTTGSFSASITYTVSND